MSGHSAEEVRKSLKTYWGVFFALLILTAVTVAVSYLHLGIGLAILVAMIVASTKAGLVAGFFMHLIGEKKVIYWILAITIVCFAIALVVPLVTIMESSGVPEMWSK